MTTETATPNQADASTAFLRAARAGQIEKIISLLEQGVDINVSNANGLNAIHLASKDGHVEVVRELLQRGAAIDAATKKGNTALHIASLAGQETVVKLLVQNGAQVNIQSQNGFTPLYMAAQENHDGVVKFLLANGANQSLATEDGFTPLAVAMQQGHEKVVAVLLEADTRGRVRLPALHIAAKKDDVKAANLLLENEHNPDVTSKSGFTPLHIAAHYGNESVARLLLAKGADVNCAAKHNICPLHVAAKWGKDNMVSLLCDNGANVEARTRDGLTPLHCAARSGHERVVEALLDRGAPITSKSKNGLAPLHMAAQGDHSEAARVLLSRRAPVDDVTVDYLTALHVAAHCGHAKVAKLLLDRNADANARALNGFTPLHIACKKNRIKVVELLLKYGASIQATTESGLTPLHVASFMGCMNIVIYLLQHEANPDVPTVRGETPLHLAARANQTDIIRILLRNGAAVEAKARERQTPLHIASRLGNVDIAVLLLQHGADVRAMTADHYNALHIAAKQHNHDVAAALIEHNAPLTATTKKGFTALHLATKYGNLKVANLLLAHGASPDQAGKNGMTPLHVAAQYDQQAVANTLLEKGADAKAVAKNGHTPLHIASRKNQMETAATLLEYGALTNAESKAGFTPLHLAAQQGHTEMCSLLLEHGASAGQQARNGLAALHLAAQEDRVPVAQLLVKNGAEVDICTKGGYTPLHIASHYGQANMVRYLLENGASVKAETTHGYTALHHAAQQGHINIVNILLEHKADANATTMNGQTPLDIASKLGYVTVMETLKEVSEPSIAPASQDKYKVVAPETMLETFMSDSEEEGGEDTILNDQPYRYLTADDMKSLGDDSLPIDVTKDERTESAMSHKNIMEISQGSVNGMPYQTQEVVVKSVSRYSTAPEGYCYNVDPTLPKKKLQWKNFLVSFLVDARGGALRGCRGGGVRVIVPPLSAQQPTRITCRYLKPSRINHMPPLMEGEALASRVLEMGPVSAKFLGPVILEVPHYASLRGKEREIVILRSDNGTSWREHNADATDDVVQDILHETLEIEETSEDEKGWDAPRVTRILTHDFPQYFAVISRIRQEVHAIGPEGGMVSSSVVPQVQAVFPQGALTKKIKVGLQAQIIDSELTAKLLGRGVAVSPVVTVEPRRRKFHKAITLSMPAPRPHTQGMTNQYSTSSAPTLRLLCSISGGTNRAHWEDVTENTPLTFVNDCVSFTTTVSARYWLIDCRHVEDATKMATELYREAIHVPFMARFVVYAKRTDECQAQLRMFCVTDDKEDKALERIERFIQVAKSRDVEVHEGKPIYLEFGGNLVPVAKSGEQLSIPFRAFRENRVAFPVMIKTQDLEPICRCQFMRDPKVPKGEPSPTPIAILNIMVPDDLPVERISPLPADMMPHRTEEQELIWRQRLSDPRLEDICNLLGKDWVALAYELGVSVATVNQIQAKRITAAEQAQLMLKLWKTQSGTKAHDNSLELALCRIGRDDIIAPQSELTNERRIQRNIYQERQASEEIEAYKAEEDNKLKESIYDDSEIAEHSRTEDLDQDEAKYSPEEKSILDKSEMDRTPTPSEESEEDEDVKRSVAERKEQITKKLSSSKIPASKQKKELREEIIEIKTQIKPDIKKFQDIEQQIKAETKIEHVRSKQTTTVHAEISSARESETRREQVVKEKTEEIKSERVEQFRKFDPSSPAKPTPKHLQRHMRNESMRFPSGDFSNVTITPRKSITIDTETRQSTESKIETFTKEPISQKEIDSARVEEKLDDGERSPDIVIENEKDIAEATLKDKINAFETKILREPVIDTTKTVKLTKEALRRHTQEQEQGIEYTQAFVRDQSKQIENQKIIIETEIHVDSAKSVKETIQHFDAKTKYEDKSKIFPKTMRTDSTLVQVSSEEDSEFLKKSTDSETETESQTTVKLEKDKKSKFEHSKHTFERTDYRQTVMTKQNVKNENKKTDTSGPKLDYDGDKQADNVAAVKDAKLEKQLTDELRLKVTDEELVEVLEEKDVSVEERIREKAESQPSMTSTKSDLSKHTKTDSLGSDLQEVTSHKMSQESTVPSAIDKTDSLADLLQSTEKDVSFVSQTESKIYSKESKHRSDSLDETSQFSDLDDQMGMSPAHKPITEQPIIEEGHQIEESILEVSKDQTLTFLKYETEHSVQVHSSALARKEEDKISPVISAKARQFIETVPEDDSVQECFFSKRIYSDSLEESDHTDSRRHSEADSLKSDQSDMKAKISSSDFDERAEYEATADSGSGFGDEKFEESIGFATIKKDSKVLESTKQDSADSGSPQTEESDIVFKKMTPKRHSRTESVSITKLSDLTEITVPVSKHEFQMIVTEAEEIDKSDKDEPSDKISSESSRELEISDRKSSEGISDKISSEDAVTDKKTSSEEDHIIKEDVSGKAPVEGIAFEGEMTRKVGKNETILAKGETLEKDDVTKRQSVTSVGSGSVSELRLEEKRLSDAHSITESRDYTFEESEDDIGTQGTHVDVHREKILSFQDADAKVKSPAKTEPSKLAKLSHGDSLDDVEGFPEDHVMDYVHKLPHIAEVSSLPEKQITSQFLSREREEQLKREIVIKESSTVTTVPFADDKTDQNVLKTDITAADIDEILSQTLDSLDDKISTVTETTLGDDGEKITTTTMTQLKEGTLGERIIKTTVTETITYPSGEERVSIKVSECIQLQEEEIMTSGEILKTDDYEPPKTITDIKKYQEYPGPQQFVSSQPEFGITEKDERILTTTAVEKATTPLDKNIIKTVTQSDVYPSGEEVTTTKVAESTYLLAKQVCKDDLKSFDILSSETSLKDQKSPTSTEKLDEEITTTTLTETAKTPEGDDLLRTTVTETIKYPSGKETVSTRVSESIKSQKDEGFTPESGLEDRIQMMLLRSDELDDDDNKISTTETQNEIGPNGEEIKRTIITETTKTPPGEVRVRTTITEVIKYPSGEESISTRVTESVKSIQHIEQETDSLRTSEQLTETDKLDEDEGKTSTTETQSEIGPDGEEIKRTIVTETKGTPSGEQTIRTTTTEVIKYPSGEESVSTRVTESVKSIQHSEQQFVTRRTLEQPKVSDKLDDDESKTSTTETQTEIGPNGEEINKTIVTEIIKAPSGEERVRNTITEVIKYPSGEESISTRVTESVKSIQHIEQETDTLRTSEKLTEIDKLDEDEGKTSTTETQSEIGPNGEEIKRTIVTETKGTPSGEQTIRTTTTEVIKYPSGEESVSTRVTESVKSIQHSEQQFVTRRTLEQPKVSDKLDDDESKTSTTETQTEIGPNGEEINKTIVTEIIKAPSGEERVRNTITEVIKYPSGEESISTRVTESVKSIQHIEQETDTLRTSEKLTEIDKLDEDEGKTSTTETQSEIGPNGEEIKRTIVTETKGTPSGEQTIRTTTTEVIKYPSGEESVSTRVTESVKSIQHIEQETDTLRTSEQLTETDKLDDDESKISTTETQTEIGPSGEEINRTILTEVIKAPSGEESVRTTITEIIKYPSGEEVISTRVTESVKLIQHSEQQIDMLRTSEQPTVSDKLDDDEGKTSITETQTEIGPNGEEIKRTVVTETTKAASGEQTVRTTITEVIKYLSGEESISTKVSESVKLSKHSEEKLTLLPGSQKSFIEDKIKHKSVAFQSDVGTEKISIASDTKQEPREKKESVPISKRTVAISETTQEQSDAKVTSSKFDISKIRTDTLSQFETDSLTSSKKYISKDMDINEGQEITKEQVTTVIDDILQKGTIVAAARSPIHEKDVKMISKEILETERRSYDAKVPHKEERRHSCISPAISLERIAESEVEMDEEVSKLSIDKKSLPSESEEESKPEIKKSDSAMKQMADNIEIIIKQASEDLDLSSEEAIFEPEESKQLQGEVSVDSIIEEAVHTVEEYLDQSQNAISGETDVKKEIVFEDIKVTKERPALLKSLSRDSGEIVIMPKKKQTRTFSVQSSPDEVEEQIYTDSESDMDKAKVLEIIEPTSDVDGKLPTSSFDIKKIKTDSLDDADDFPDKETEYFEDGEKYPEDSQSFHFKDKEHHKQPEPSSSTQPESDDDKFSETYVKKTHFVDSVRRSELVSKSTTESSVTTVISTLTKSSDDDQKSVLEDGTSADLSKISGADLVKDPSKTSIDAKEESRIEDQTDDLSKKTIDLTKDYSKSSIDSKDTSRDFATNELSKDSTVDLTNDFSKASIDSVKETSRSLDEKTFSEEHSSFDVSKTLASDASDIISKSKEFIEEERSILKAFSIPTSFSQEPSVTTESKMSEYEDKSEPEIEKDLTDKVLETPVESKNDVDYDKKDKISEIEEHQTEETTEVPDIKELNRRCSNLLEDISAQGALIRIDSSHVTHDLSSKFSKTPPPSPVDLIMKERVKREEIVIDKTTGLLPKGSDSSFLDANRQSPRASSAGDSLISETEAHQSELLTEPSEALSSGALQKSPTKDIAENITFVNVDKPTITIGAQELVDRTIEKSIDVIDQIKKEMHEDVQISSSSDTFYSESKIETSTSSSSIQKTIEGTQLKFQNIDPEAVMSDMVSKFGTTTEYSTILSHKETETRKISGQEYFSETKQVSSSDDDSLIIKTETSHELRGQEHEMKEKMTITRDGNQTETSQKKMEKAHEATAKRSDVETKTVFKSTDDTDIIKVEREFLEQGLYTGRQTKSEEKMTALKDEIIKKKQEVKISERDLSHEQWGKEYFTQPGELEDIKEDGDSKTRIAFVDSSLKIVEKDEILSSIEVSEKGHIISSKVEHHKEESVIESKEHDDLSSDASHVASFKSETVEKHDSSEASPKSKSKSFKKDDEVYEVDFIKEIKVSTSPVKSTFSRTGSQDTHSESEVLPELPHDDKISETLQKEKPTKSPVKLPQNQLENLILEVSFQKDMSAGDQTSSLKPDEKKMDKKSTTVTMSAEKNLEIKETSDTNVKVSKLDISPSTLEITDDISTTSKDVMIKSGESIDTEYMVKSLESHEAEVLQKSMDSTVSAETLHASEFSTEADSAFLTGTDQKKEGIKLLKEKSTEDVCSSGYDTDFSSAEFHGMKLETERVALDSIISAQPLADLSVLEKTIDEVKQSLEAAQGEIISEKSDGSIKYKQSPSEFQFKILISPDRPEVIKEEPNHVEDQMEKKTITDDIKEIVKDYQTDSISQKVSSQEETTFSDEERGTVQLKESSPPLEGDISIRSDSGPHSILETESDIVLSDKNDSSKGSPEIKLRVQKHIKSQLGIVDRRSASEIEGWSSSGESHYQSFEHSESRPLSSDIEVMMTAQSGTDYETALTSQDLSFQSLRTSKDYFTAGSSLASRDSMRSLDSDASSHVASIDISDASETLVPSANELKEELLESSTYVEQFLHGQEKEPTPKAKEVSDDEISGDEDCKSDVIGHVGKMKRSHEMRFQPKEMIPEHFPLEGTSESIEVDDDSLRDKEGSDTTISSQLRTDEILSSSISKLDISQIESDKEEIKESIAKSSVHIQEALPFSVTKIDKPQREFVDIESDIIPVGSAEYQQIEKFGCIITTPLKPQVDETIITETVIKMDESTPQIKKMESELSEVKEEFVQKVFQEISAIPFPIAEKPSRQREFVDIEDDIIPEGTKQYEEILKSKSDSSVPKTKIEKSGIKTPEGHLESKQSSTSSLKTHEHLSTPQTPLSAPSQSSLSTDNGREYVLDDMYDISETPELKSDLHTVSSRSELVVTTEERTLQTYEKEQESPTSDEFEMLDKPCEMDDFVVIEEVAKEAQETDPEGKSLQIKSQTYVKRHDTEVEEYLSRTTKKQESTSSASGSLSDEDLQLYELEQKRVQAQELAEIEAGKRWIQMQFEGDPRYDYERIPLEDIKEEEMTDFDASRIGSLSSQKESIGSYGSFRNSYGSLSESEMASRMRFRLKGENDDISISSLQEFENLERALMEQYNQHSSSQESLNGSLPRRYILNRSQGDDISVSSLKEFEGLESACLEALKAELIAKQKEALLLADPKVVSGSFLEQEKRSYDSSSESSPPLKSSGSPGQKSGSPSQKSGSPSQKVGSYGSPSQRLLADSAAIRKLIDQQLALEQRMQESRPKVVIVKKSDERGSFFVSEPLPGTSEDKTCEIEEECKKASTFTCAAAPSDGSAESIPGDCEEMMKILDLEEKSKEQTEQRDTTQQSETGVIEFVRTTTVIQQKFVDGKKISETIKNLDNEGAIDIPTKSKQYDDNAMSFSSEMSSSLASQPSEMDSLMTIIERYPSETEIVTYTKHTVITSERHEDKPEDLDFSREGSAVRELSPSSGRSVAHSIVSGKYFTDPASGSWSGQDEELSSSGSFSRARADLMLGSTDSLEATSSNATRATYNYEVDTPMTGSLTSGARPPGSNTMVSSLDTLDPVTAVQMESLEHQSTSEHYSQDYEVHEPDSDTERLELDGRIPQAKERTIMFDSTDTLSAVSGDGSVREATVEAPAATFYIGDTPIVKGEKREEQDDSQPTLSESCPAALPPPAQSSPPIPAQRRSLSMIPKPSSSSSDETKK